MPSPKEQGVITEEDKSNSCQREEVAYVIGRPAGIDGGGGASVDIRHITTPIAQGK